LAANVHPRASELGVKQQPSYKFATESATRWRAPIQMILLSSLIVG
jgi:hypothetical protein